MKKINDSLEYRKFIKARDRALEQLHQTAQQKQSDILRGVLENTLNAIKAHYFNLIDPNRPHEIDALSNSLKRFYVYAAGDLARIAYDLRKNAFLLSNAAETEALARVLDQPVNLNIPKQKIDDHAKRPSLFGGSIERRAQLYLDRLRRKICSTVQMVAMQKDENDLPPALETMLLRVVQIMPKPRIVRQPRRLLSPKLIEADKKPGISVAIDLGVDDATWEKMVDAYLEEYIPRNRGPQAVVQIAGKTPDVDPDEWYAWEFERDLTNEFLKSVRNGEIDAANQAGVTDFVWVAIIDSKTCDNCCDGSGCVQRDGLLTSEIEKQFGDPIAPPAHFNCRCRLVPALDSIPEKPQVDYESFNDWLNK